MSSQKCYIKCHLCDEDYADQATLKQHLRNARQEACLDEHQVNLARGSADGLAQCAHCLHVHPTCDVQMHIASGACKDIDPEQPIRLPIALHLDSHKILSLSDSGEKEALIQWIKYWPSTLTNYSIFGFSCGHRSTLQ